jgi:hypothetical protein
MVQQGETHVVIHDDQKGSAVGSLRFQSRRHRPRVWVLAPLTDGCEGCHDLGCEALVGAPGLGLCKHRGYGTLGVPAPFQRLHLTAEEGKFGLFLSIRLALQSFIIVGLLVVPGVVFVLTVVVLGPSGLFFLVWTIIVGFLRFPSKLRPWCFALDLIPIALRVLQPRAGGFGLYCSLGRAFRGLQSPGGPFQGL